MDGQAATGLSPDGGSESADWPRQQQQQQQQHQHHHHHYQTHHHHHHHHSHHHSHHQQQPSEAWEDHQCPAQRRQRSPPPIPRGVESPSRQGSPATIPGTSRRQGVAFCDSPAESDESADAPARQHNQRHPGTKQPGQSSTTRPRTRTLDAAVLTPRAPPPIPDRQRPRVGSLSSSGSQPVPDLQRSPPLAAPPPPVSTGVPSVPSYRHPEPSTPSGSSRTRDKKTASSSNKRLLKRLSSRPTSPVAAPAVSVDSLPTPIAAAEPAKLVSLIKALYGRMRGEVEYQQDAGGVWHAGYAYIDEGEGSLVCGQPPRSSAAAAIDLRACRVSPVEWTESGKACLEVVASGQLQRRWRPGETEILLLRPLASDEWNLWLAALLCWQQVRPAGAARTANGGGGGGGGGCSSTSSPVLPVRPGLRKQGRSGSSDGAPRGSTIIKVGTVMLWDKGPAATPRDLVQRPSTRGRRSCPTPSWRTVSCILHEDGEFRLLRENDISVLCVVQLSQLSRHSVQRLDPTVLDHEFCIAIFPIYASSSTQLSIFRPVYLALDGRVPFEVWLVLLRALAVPDIYKLDSPDDESIPEAVHAGKEPAREVFRIEKTVGVRVVEAKVKARPTTAAWPEAERWPRTEADPLVGNYLAEVILDGEVRARTTTQMATKNPFWRQECEFADLPPSVRELSIVLKRVDGIGNSGGGSGSTSSLETTARKSTGSGGGLLDEADVVCGTVKVLLDQLERGKDHEEWLHIADDRQQPVGSMLVKVCHAEHVALLAKEYEPLSELLHRFPTGLTTLISAAVPGQLRRLSETFLDIFQASGSASDWLMTLVEDEIDGIGSQTSIKKFRFSSRLQSGESTGEGGGGGGSGSAGGGTGGGGWAWGESSPGNMTAAAAAAADRELLVRDMSRSLAGEANLLFRGNTLLTQSLEFHMRRLGAEYLEEVLRDKIVEINVLNPDCEVDPSKLMPFGHHHHHHHHHHVGAAAADLDQRWNRLMLLTTEVWHCIAGSADGLPAELRHILKYIRAVAEDRYGDFLRTVTYTAVSGFLFLRFICPAILSPKLFGLLRDRPRPHAQRTLTLIAKVLQKMSNMSTFGKREEWMEPMNKFLAAQRPVLRDYIDRVCGIPAEQRGAMRSVPASYSTPVTMLGRLGPTAREGFPSLPYLIDGARSLASLVKLWVDWRPADLGSSRGQAGSDDAALLAFDDLCSGLQRRADACLAEVARVRAAEAASGGGAERLLADSREQAALVESLVGPPPPHASTPTAAAGACVDVDGTPGSSGSDGVDDDMAAAAAAATTSQRRSKQGRGAGGSSSNKGRNAKVGKTILSGIMRIGGRAESPDAKQQQQQQR